jgi:hypothetical protein
VRVVGDGRGWLADTQHLLGGGCVAGWVCGKTSDGGTGTELGGMLAGSAEHTSR